MPQINDDVSSLVVAQLLYLQSEDPKMPIHMYINSPGEWSPVVNAWLYIVYIIIGHACVYIKRVFGKNPEGRGQHYINYTSDTVHNLIQ